MASLAPAEKAPAGKPLKVGSPHDPAEREADRIADLLTAPEEPAMPVCAACAAGGAPCPACGGDGGGVLRRQVAAGGDGDSGGEMVAPPSVHRVLGEPGEPLPAGIRGKFERRLGVDLAPVRLHTGPDAARAAASVNARAFAFGHHVPLSEEAPIPTSQAGKRLLAHEVAHVAMGHGADTLRRDGPTAPASGGAPAAADIIIDRLEGYTSASDSEDILGQFRGQGPGQVLAIMQAVKSRGPQHDLDAAGMVDWLLGDLTEENRRELRGLLARSGSPDMSRILLIEIKDRLDGYTSEADSTEILAAFSSFSSGISSLLSALETAMGQDEAAMRSQLFGDLDRVNAERLRQLFFAQGGSRGIDYAATWTAGKIESLLAGWTGHSDSTDILWNLQSTPASVRPLVQQKLNAISKQRWSTSAEDALREEMDRSDYEALRRLKGMALRAYDRKREIDEILLSGVDWGLTVAQWLICGVAGIITGVFAAIWDILLAIKGIGVAIWDLLWSLVYLISGGAAGSSNWMEVKTFFSSIGTLFTDPGRVWDQYWEQKRLEFSTIEGSFSDCRRAEYLVRNFVTALVNIALMFLAGYGLAKGAVSAVRGGAQAAELAMNAAVLEGKAIGTSARRINQLGSMSAANDNVPRGLASLPAQRAVPPPAPAASTYPRPATSYPFRGRDPRAVVMGEGTSPLRLDLLEQMALPATQTARQPLRLVPPPAPTPAIAPPLTATAPAAVPLSTPPAVATGVAFTPVLLSMASGLLPSGAPAPSPAPPSSTQVSPCSNCDDWRKWNHQFMSEKKSQIIANPSHPLRFLIDATTGAWRSRFQLNALGVHAGHRDNKNSCVWGFGGEMSLAIELGWDNSSWDSSTDRQAAVMGKPTIVIDGVEIDLDTAKWFKNEMIAGRIQATELEGMDLDNFAVSSKGWQPDECQ